jgi:hypothetical protein
LAKSNQKQLKEQEEKHTMEIAAMKRATLDPQNLLTTKTTPDQTMNDRRTTAHFNAMTKPSETIFDRTPYTWPAFEHHLLTEAENPNISWNQDITNYQPTDGNSEPFNFFEIYFDLPDNMTNTLVNELSDAKIIDIVSLAWQLYKLHCLRTKLKKLLANWPRTWHRSIYVNWAEKQRWTTLFHQTGITNLPRQTIPQSNNLQIHPKTWNNRIKQHGRVHKGPKKTHQTIWYNQRKRMEENHQPQHWAISENRLTPLNTGFNMLVVTGPSPTHTKYGGIGVQFKWTNSTHHDLIKHNIWPKPEITTNQELDTMTMHDKQWGTNINSWKSQGTTAK